MAFASLSILGLYEWNEQIFDNLTLPQGMSKEVLVPELVTECADFPLLYPDYDFMKMLIGVWSTKEQKIWADMYRSENLQYNPIENYDRTETITREVNSTSETSAENTRTGSDDTSTTSTAGATAFNSIDFRDTAQNVTESEISSTGTSTDTSENTSAGTEEITARAHGNIGVTTAQQMIEGFRAVSDFCTYDFIIRSFKNRFCIQVY